MAGARTAKGVKLIMIIIIEAEEPKRERKVTGGLSLAPAGGSLSGVSLALLIKGPSHPDKVASCAARPVSATRRPPHSGIHSYHIFTACRFSNPPPPLPDTRAYIKKSPWFSSRML